MTDLNKRARKRLRKRAEEAEAAEHFRYGLLADETLRAPDAFRDLGCEVVDVEVMPQFDGSPEDMAAWLIFATRTEAKEAAESSERLEARARELLEDKGFPRNALPSFRLAFTSIPEIEEGGGRFYFFR